MRLACILFLSMASGPALAQEMVDFTPPAPLVAELPLTVNQDNTLCARWRSGAIKAFLSPSLTLLHPTLSQDLAPVAKPLRWTALIAEKHRRSNKASSSSLYGARMTKIETVAHWDAAFIVEHLHSWRGNNYDLILSRNERSTRLLHGLILKEPRMQEIDKMVQEESGLSHITGAPSIWLDWLAWSYQGHLYVAQDSSRLQGYVKHRQAPYGYTLYKAHEEKLTAVCSITPTPEYDHSGAKRAKITAGKKIAPFIERIEKMAGVGGYCGTLNAPRNRLGNGRMVERLLLDRPWAVHYDNGATSLPWSGRDKALRRYFNFWGAQGLWEHELMQGHDQLRTQAEDSLSSFYQQVYRYSKPDARALAAHNIDVYLGHHFAPSKIPSWATNVADMREYVKNYDLGNLLAGRFSINYQGKVNSSTLLRMAVILELPKEDIMRIALAHLDVINKHATRLRQASSRNVDPLLLDPNPALSQAVKQPDIVRTLLSMGFPVDAPNEFGKTPLMYAAQYDQPETVKTLLSAGADVHAKTKQVRRCGLTVQKRRTALDYATENAGEETIALIRHAMALSEQKNGRPQEDRPM